MDLSQPCKLPKYVHETKYTQDFDQFDMKMFIHLDVYFTLKLLIVCDMIPGSNFSFARKSVSEGWKTRESNFPA